MPARTESLDSAASRIRAVDQLAVPLGPGQPSAFMHALAERDDWEDLQIFGALLVDLYPIFLKPGVHYLSGFFGPAERLLRDIGRRHPVRTVRLPALRPDRRRPRTQGHGDGRHSTGRRRIRQPLAPRRRDRRRAAPGRRRPRPRPRRRGQREVPTHLRTAARVATPAPSRRDRRDRRERHDPVFTMDDAAPTDVERRIAECGGDVRLRRLHSPDGHRRHPDAGGQDRSRPAAGATTACTRRCSPPASCTCTRPAR